MSAWQTHGYKDLWGKSNKNNSRYTKLIPAQEKIIITGSSINYKYIKLNPHIDDINYSKQKDNFVPSPN